MVLRREGEGWDGVKKKEGEDGVRKKEVWC